MYDPNDETGPYTLNNVYWYKPDFGEVCTEPGKEKQVEPTTMAHKVPATRHSVPIIRAHMCSKGYNLPLLIEKNCNGLKGVVRNDMSVIGGVVLPDFA